VTFNNEEQTSDEIGAIFMQFAFIFELLHKDQIRGWIVVLRRIPTQKRKPNQIHDVVNVAFFGMSESLDQNLESDS